MYSKTVVQILYCFVLISSEVINENFNEFPDYGNEVFESTKDIQQSFIKNRKRNDETAKRIQLLDKYLPNNTVYIDEIAHFEILKNHTEWKNVNEIEKEFRYLIGMRGLTYTYKRDTFWQTWRLVRYPAKIDKVVFYKSKHSVNATGNEDSGYWVIEEKPPPCPYELFSISKDNKICAVHLDKYYDVRNSCSSEINISDLTESCNNPITTEWHIEKQFKAKVSERFPYVICGGREYCTISTLYKIADDYISLRIVNTTNDVIYSRIMKQDKRNFACIKDCGRVDPNSKNILSKEKSLRINLLSKKKREDNTVYVNKSNQLPFANKEEQVNLEDNHNSDNIIYRWMKSYDVATEAPTCKGLKQSFVKDEMDEDE